MENALNTTSGSRPFRNTFAVILGTNEIASALAVYMHRGGWSTLLSHDPDPPVIRRRMAFHDALFGDHAEVDGVIGESAKTFRNIAVLLGQGHVVITRLRPPDLTPLSEIGVLIDGRMQKRAVAPDLRQLATMTVGIGPEFTVGENCDIAIETRPAKNGAIVSHGRTDAADGKSSLLGGIGGERFVYSQAAGRWHCAVAIGMRVFKNFSVGVLNGIAINAPFDGVLRGVVRDGTEVPARVKLLEVDPRGRHACWTGIDERGRAIAEATLKAVAIEKARRAGAKAF